MGDTIRLIGAYTKTTMKAWFQYRVDAVLRSLAVFIQSSVFDIWNYDIIFYRIARFGIFSERW